jgi:hypothetical protein
VKDRQLGVRRTCWDRGNSEKSSVNVKVTVNVNGDGSVSNATATGDDPAVAHCIENSVKGWRFPSTGGSSTVQIPFHFVRQ